MSSDIVSHQPEYSTWLGELKTRFRQVQLKAAVAVNTALLQFYWELGADLVARQAQFAWGSGFLSQLSADLMRDFPDVKGFSKRNLEQIRRWYLFWSPSAPIAKQPVAPIFSNKLSLKFAILIKRLLHNAVMRGQLPRVECLGQELIFGMTPFGGSETEEGGV